MNPISFETSLKKYFFSISLAIIGSNIKEVFPDPDPPHTNKEEYLEISGITIDLPVSLFVHKNVSHVYIPRSFVVSAKLIPP